MDGQVTVGVTRAGLTLKVQKESRTRTIGGHQSMAPRAKFLEENVVVRWGGKRGGKKRNN